MTDTFTKGFGSKAIENLVKKGLLSEFVYEPELTDDKILNYEFLDAVMVGPYDLSASLGICGNFESDIFKDAYLEIKKNCEDKNIPFGIHLIEPNSSKLKDLILEGARFIAFSMDSVMLHHPKPKV